MGMEVKQKQEQTFYFSWTLKDEDKDKKQIVVQKIEGVKLTIQIAGNPITLRFDEPDDANNALAEFFKALVGTEFTADARQGHQSHQGRRPRRFPREADRRPTSRWKPLLKRILSEEASSRWPTRPSACCRRKPSPRAKPGQRKQAEPRPDRLATRAPTSTSTTARTTRTRIWPRSRSKRR